MYVCICHALTDVDVRAAETEGAASDADEVFRHFGVKPECGRCVPCMRGLLAGGCRAAGEQACWAASHGTDG